MNWKEVPADLGTRINNILDRYCTAHKINFLQTKELADDIARLALEDREKLIADIPEKIWMPNARGTDFLVSSTALKQQLRDKWL